MLYVEYWRLPRLWNFWGGRESCAESEASDAQNYGGNHQCGFPVSCKYRERRDDHQPAGYYTAYQRVRPACETAVPVYMSPCASKAENQTWMEFLYTPSSSAYCRSVFSSKNNAWIKACSSGVSIARAVCSLSTSSLWSTAFFYALVIVGKLLGIFIHQPV